jgi:Rrf2 family transcriptional regulator, cysteine metabolism repressor
LVARSTISRPATAGAFPGAPASGTAAYPSRTCSETRIAPWVAGAYGLRVKLSVKSDYGARAVLGLARHFPTGMARRVEELAIEQGIPANYLTQILLELKANQIVKSQRGKEGGYLLARPPAEITMGDVLRAIHGPILESPGMADPRSVPELRGAWKRLKESLEQTADGINFQQLLDESQGRDKMYYI